ncbi:MAG: FAD:protein FMN transferase [Acidobacteriota bacterium]
MHRSFACRSVVFSAAFAFGVAVMLSACGPEPPQAFEHRFTGEAMGTTWTVKVIRPVDRPLSDAESESLQTAIEAELEAVNRSMSTYLADSELSLLNAAPAAEAQELSPSLAEVLAEALRVSAQTGGAFDVTVGPLVDAWGFGPANAPTPPSDAELEALRARVGWRFLELDADARTLTRGADGVQIDLSALAKGYAVDRVFERLRATGEADILVEVGGETRTGGRNREGVGWRLGIEKPQATRAVQRLVQLEDEALATSGDYRNARRLADGSWVSHLIDPRTGRTADHVTASVSVLRPTCIEADALATAYMILGPDEGLALATRDGVPALFLVRDGDNLREIASPAFQNRST